MRVMLTIGSLGGGGAERVMSWLAGALAESGESVCLLTQTDTSNDFYDLHPSVKRISVGFENKVPIPKVKGAVNVLRWYRAVRRVGTIDRPDVVLSFVDKANISVLLALAGTRLPVIVAERIDPRFSILSPIERAIRPVVYRALARQVVVQTEPIASQVRRDWNLNEVAVIPNAVMVRSAPGSSDVVREPRVLSVGRLSPQKGHDVLIESWSRVVTRCPGWQLRIVGEGACRSVLERQIERLGLNDSVSLPGMVADVAKEYQSASIFALSSRFEGCPNALLEAMACGCPVVATNTPGATAQLIDAGVNGILVPGDDVPALAAALSQLIEDSELRRLFSERGAATAQEFAPDRVFKMWHALLRSSAGLTSPEVTRQSKHQTRLGC